jgi:hypothetical protein
VERPRLRVADIARRFGDSVRARHPLDASQRRALAAMALCRTAALGGHLEVCDGCGHSIPSYNSCRNRHCPSCQGRAAHEWVERRMERILPVPHFHAVFTVPSELRPLFRGDREILYDVLLRAAARTLEAVAARRLGVAIGTTAVLHTWNQSLQFHPHVHCIVTGGGVASDGTWKAAREGYLLPVRWLSGFFRGAVVRHLKELRAAGRLHLDGPLASSRGFAAFTRELYRKGWNVHVKRPFAGPEGVFRYLGRYTHRVGISDGRLVEVTDVDVTFRRRDAEPLTLPGDEFLRRLLLHVLPSGFRKIRHYGLYAPGAVRQRLPRAHDAVVAAGVALPVVAATVPESVPSAPTDPDTGRADCPRKPCPACGLGHLQLVLVSATVRPRALPPPAPRDSS